MLLRTDPGAPDDGIVAITQPAHGWVAGQLARAWARTVPREWEPHEEVCLAAEQHDVAWTAWERAPTLDPQTGRPHSFLTLPLTERLAMWPGAAARLVLPQSRYAAVLVSMHATYLHRRVDVAHEPPHLRQALQDFLAEEHAFRQALLDSLLADPHYAPYVADDVVARNYALVNACDRLSLVLCAGVSTTRVLQHVLAAGDTTLTIEPLPDGPDRVRVDPWPFRAGTVRLVWEGRRLRGTFADEQAMRAALDHAPWVTFAVTLCASA